MLGGIVSRLWVPASGLILTAGLVVQSGAVRSWLPLGPGLADEPEAAPSVPTTPKVVAEGHVVAYPGAEVLVGSERAGLVVELPVVEQMAVKKGDLIAALRSDDLRAERAEAVARAEEAEADIRYYDREVRREERLIARSFGTAETLDGHRRALDAARARRAVALAQRDRLDALIAKTRIVAPIDGVVTVRHADPGETLDAGAPVATVVDLSRLRIEAEVDEYDTARLALEQPVAITAEGYPTSWRGLVEEIPDAVTGRRLRPEDPGRPIDSRVLPVKIALDGRTPLKLGQRVEVAIELTASPGLANR
jgi:RND family efflux transporter MFP subunit